MPLAAQDAEPEGRTARSGRVAYAADFFATFQPQTVLDMLARLPGFSLETGDDVRGFGANAGNVLIDGQRPTVKTGGIEAALGRIVASRVERIELVRGSGSADAMGRAVIANVVLKKDGGGSGNLSFELRHAPGDSAITPRLEASYARPIGPWQASASLLAFYENNPERGTLRWFDADDAPIAASRERLDSRFRGVTLTLGASGILGGGTLALNGRWGHERERWRQTLAPIVGPADPSEANGHVRQQDSELGIDWTRSLGRDWTLKLVSLGRREAQRVDERTAQGGGVGGIAYRSTMTELVGRGTVQRQGDHWLSPEIGGEIAWNRLDRRFSDLASSYSEHKRVSELRADMFANATVRLSRALRLETGLAFEVSRIAVDDDRDLSRTLRYWKPNAALVWDIGPATQARAGVRRTVGQLDFEAFAASADVIDNRPITGNAELRPDATTAWSVTLDHRFGTGGALALSASREIVSDALAYVPLTGGGQALANYGTLRLWRLGGKATVPLDTLVRGGRLTVEGEYVEARRPDPVTGGTRADSSAQHSLEVAWRHDLERLRSAWGVSVEYRFPERAWFVDEYQRESYNRYVTAYVETMLPHRVKATLTAWGLFGNREYRARRFFDPDRSGALALTERRERRHGAYVALLLARQF